MTKSASSTKVFPRAVDSVQPNLISAVEHSFQIQHVKTLMEIQERSVVFLPRMVRKGSVSIDFVVRMIIYAAILVIAVIVVMKVVNNFLQ